MILQQAKSQPRGWLFHQKGTNGSPEHLGISSKPQPLHLVPIWFPQVPSGQLIPFLSLSSNIKIVIYSLFVITTFQLPLNTTTGFISSEVLNVLLQPKHFTHSPSPFLPSVCAYSSIDTHLSKLKCFAKLKQTTFQI